MRIEKKTVLSSLFALWFLSMAGSAHAEYAYDCKVDWICHGPELCAKSGKELSLAVSGDLLVFENGSEAVGLEDLDMYRVDGEMENGEVFSGFDSEGGFTVASLNRNGRMQISTHRLPRGNSIFTKDGALLTAYLTCRGY